MVSNAEADFFVFDRESDRFRLKAPVASYRGRAEHRELAADRSTHALKHYFHRETFDKS